MPEQCPAAVTPVNGTPVLEIYPHTSSSRKSSLLSATMAEFCDYQIILTLFD